jgi:hypothetical protein
VLIGRRVGVVTVLAGVALWAAAAPASATVGATPTTISLSFVVPATPCTGEAVAVEGTLQLVSSSTTDGAGGLHTVSVFSSQRLVGTGLETGAIYNGRYGGHSTFTLSGPPQSSVTDTFQMVLVGAGGVGNLVILGVFHETVDANGVVQAQVDVGGATCTG